MGPALLLAALVSSAATAAGQSANASSSSVLADDAAAVAALRAQLAAAEARLAQDQARLAPPDPDAGNVTCEDALSMRDENGTLCITPEHMAGVCATLHGFGDGTEAFAERLQGALDAMELDGPACFAMRYIEYGPAALVLALLLLCCGYPCCAFFLAYGFCIRPRASKGYQPGREAWRACALVLVLVFWVLGCASPTPPELGPADRPCLVTCQGHLLSGVGCRQGAGECGAAGAGAAVLLGAGAVLHGPPLLHRRLLPRPRHQRHTSAPLCPPGSLTPLTTSVTPCESA